jgi:ABC-type dipeptide/oligopeptide/nickel transport system permease component
MPTAGRQAALVGYFVMRRLLSAAVGLTGVTLIVFIVTHLLADPVYLLVGQRASAGQIEALRHQLGYDRPLLVQYGSYLWALLHGDLGTSRYTFQSVSTELAQRFPTTLELTIAAVLMGLLWTIPLGVLSAIRPGGWIDRAGQALVEFGIAMPSFWLGLLFVYVFFFLLHVAPAPIGEIDFNVATPPRVTGLLVVDSAISGNLPALQSAAGHLFLPALTLAITACPPILQITRTLMLQILGSDFIKAARSYGLPNRIIYWRYAFKNVSLPIVTLSAMTFAYLLGGTALVETVFSWPGIGLYAVQSMGRSDYDPVLAVVLLASAVYFLLYLMADLAALAIDPRTRHAR